MIKIILIYMLVEFIIGLIIVLLTWLKVVYQTNKFPSTYKIINSQLESNKKIFSDYLFSGHFYSFFGLDYKFAFIEYDENTIVNISFYTLLASHIKVIINSDGSHTSYKSIFTSPMYLFTAVIPMILGTFFPSSSNFAALPRRYLLISGLIWLFIGIVIPSIWSQLKLEYKEASEQIDKENNTSK